MAVNTTRHHADASKSFGPFTVSPLPDATFGGRVELANGQSGARAFIETAEADPGPLSRALYDAEGLLFLPGMDAISDDPEFLLRLSRLFGAEVEDYSQTLIAKNMIHPSVPEIFIVSNIEPAIKLPPARPTPPLTESGELPTQFPHRRGWHTDQSYRRPPPDVSLFYAVIPSPEGQGQTLYANGIAAYDALSNDLKAQAQNLIGIHVMLGAGRSEYAARAGKAPKPLEAHQQPQHQPVVRTHPVTGRRALFLCEAGQMDWVDGPFVGMAPGPDGAGAKLLYELMAHYTHSAFTYTHNWSKGDLVVYDNRSLIHAATWFDSDAYQRLMWRTTTWGNPGPDYDGEARSWIPK